MRKETEALKSNCGQTYTKLYHYFFINKKLIDDELKTENKHNLNVMFKHENNILNFEGQSIDFKNIFKRCHPDKNSGSADDITNLIFRVFKFLHNK